MNEHHGNNSNFSENREKASEAAQKGSQHNGGNFKNDPQRASEAGHKGGQQGQHNPHSSGKNR